MTKGFVMNGLIEKMQSPDQDHRYMGLSDLMGEIKTDVQSFSGDEAMESKVLNQVLKLVEDKISEVKNQAVKCLGVLIRVVREQQMDFIIQKLVTLSSSREGELRDIAGLALQTITKEIPEDSPLAPKACAKLAPKLLEQTQNSELPPENLTETLSILSVMITRFPVQFSSPELKPPPVPTLTPLLGHPRAIVRKRTITTLAQFTPFTEQALFDDLLNETILPALRLETSSSAALEQQRTIVQLAGSIARLTPTRLGPCVDSIAPAVLKTCTKEDDELREYALATLEVLVLRCPTEITPFLGQIVQTGTKLIKYDPNYNVDDDDEDTEMDGMDDEDDEDDDVNYSDDEDTSYKVRRLATKLLAALIETRPEMLSSLYTDVSPVLIQRFGDREQSVQLEIWETYGKLLNQTKVYGGLPQNVLLVESPGVGGKRKRAESNVDGMDVEASEGPVALLRSQTPSLTKALLKPMSSSKASSQVVQAAFTLLSNLIEVVPGTLAATAEPISVASQNALKQSLTTSSIALHTTCLSFLTTFFATHPASVFTSAQKIVPHLLKDLNERHPKVVTGTFRAFSALLNMLRPVDANKHGEWVSSLYDATVARLSNPSTDAEVRHRAEVCMGDLWICATDVVKPKGGKEWDAMCRTSGSVDNAVKVVTQVARDVDVGDNWLNGCVEWLLGVLKKPGKTGKGEIFTGLEVLLKKFNAAPDNVVSAIVEQMKSYISTSDIPALAHALSLLSVLLEIAPAKTYPAIESGYLKDIYLIAHSPLLAGSSLDSLLGFFSQLVQADSQIAPHVITSVTFPLANTSKGDASYGNVAKVIRVVVERHQGLAAGTIAEFSKALKSGSKASNTQIILNLLVIGEIGRTIDFSQQKDIFDNAIEKLGSTDEEVRSAASYATGNIAIGNLHLFLPTIVKLVQHDEERRLLALHALKEVVSNCPMAHLESVAEAIWGPLFQNSANADESTRNVGAACLGKLTTTNPSRYLPKLQEHIRDQDPAIRATVFAAIRYTFTDSRSSYDDVLESIVPEFITGMQDNDITVRRFAMSALDSAARNKPKLIRGNLPDLLPLLYKETVINKDLIRTVQMGPWTHKVDDGLETRKTAFETMYTLLDTCLAKLDLPTFINALISGLSDTADEIQVLSHMMLFRLSSFSVASTALTQRLDDITPPLDKTMRGAKETKDTVKQDLERSAELQRSSIRAIAALAKGTQKGASAKFDALVEDVNKGRWAAAFKEVSTGH